MRIGIDLGGVVIDSSGPDTFFGPDYLRVQPMDQAFETLSYLSADHEIYVVSKCGPRIEVKSRAWLEHWNFTALTGVPSERWYFVRHREDKAPVAADLGLTAFVDDREDVLSYMPSGIQRILFTTWEVARKELKQDRV